MTTIKSRPVYPGLSPDLNARKNVCVCDEAGAEAIVELFASAGGPLAERSLVLLAAETLKTNGRGPVTERLSPAEIEVSPTLDAAIVRFREVLSRAAMGLRVYVAGSEPLIGSVIQAAADFGIDHKSIRTEQRGSLKRRVQCVHCKGIIEDVTTSPVRCTHCGLFLFVRDHYSRRLAAFQGVCVDAECPGEIPEIKVLYS